MTTTPRDIATELHRCARQAYGLRDQRRTLKQKLAAQADWRDLTPEAQQRRLAEAQEAIRTALHPEVERARALAAPVVGDAEERLSAARYFRSARFTEDATLEALTRIQHALELPRTPAKTLAAMALDCAARGGDAAAALLTLIRRERDHRVAAGLDMTSGEGFSLTVDLAKAEREFPLPEAIEQERQAVAEIARALDGIESAFAEVSLPEGAHHDLTDRIEHYRQGGDPTELAPLPAAGRSLPGFEIHHDDNPQAA